MITKPMLASAIKDINALQYPVIASPKLDGIRCLKIAGQVVSRAFKPIPNHHIRQTLERILPDGADGEIIIGTTFQECTSGVMSHDGEPDFTYWIFDYVSEDITRRYDDRLLDLALWFSGVDAETQSIVTIVPTEEIENSPNLTMYECGVLSEGYEGIMVRTPDSPYKCGRATVKQGWLLKLKRFEDSEAVILDVEEMMHNKNEAEKDNFGRTKRSTKKDGMVPAGVLGGFVVQDIVSDVQFRIGSGFDAAQRREYWGDRKKLIGSIVKYKFQPTGVKEAPRFPVFIGFRDKADM